jgi:hypothetical protein
MEDNYDQDMDLRQQQHQRDEERVDQEREASHPLHAQAMSNGYKVSVVTLLSHLQVVLNDMSQFQRLASLHDRLIAARTRFQPRGGQPGQEREPESEATQTDVAVEAQAQAIVIAPLQAIGSAEVQAQVIGTAEAQAQATGTAEARAQEMVSAAEAPPQGIEGGQCDTQASPLSPLCRWP